MKYDKERRKERKKRSSTNSREKMDRFVSSTDSAWWVAVWRRATASQHKRFLHSVVALPPTATSQNRQPIAGSTRTLPGSARSTASPQTHSAGRSSRPRLKVTTQTCHWPCSSPLSGRYRPEVVNCWFMNSRLSSKHAKKSARGCWRARRTASGLKEWKDDVLLSSVWCSWSAMRNYVPVTFQRPLLQFQTTFNLNSAFFLQIELRLQIAADPETPGELLMTINHSINVI